MKQDLYYIKEFRNSGAHILSDVKKTPASELVKFCEAFRRVYEAMTPNLEGVGEEKIYQYLMKAKLLENTEALLFGLRIPSKFVNDE